MSHDDFAFDPVPGLPEHLPKGETMLWQGSPDWYALARSVFHVRFVAAYFAIMMVWQVITAFYDGKSALDAFGGAVWLAGLAALCLGLIALIARAMARTTIYTITDKRLVMRIGVALPVTINLPFKRIDSAASRLNPDGTGDITVSLVKGERVSYAVLWPHARPFKMSQPEPALRAIPDAARVAAILSSALATSASRPDARSSSPLPENVQPLRSSGMARAEETGQMAVARIA